MHAVPLMKSFSIDELTFFDINHHHLPLVHTYVCHRLLIGVATVGHNITDRILYPVYHSERRRDNKNEFLRYSYSCLDGVER